VKRVTKTAHAAGPLKLRIVPTGRFKKNLGSRGKVKVSVTIGFVPTGGTAAQVQKKLTLFEKIPRDSGA